MTTNGNGSRCFIEEYEEVFCDEEEEEDEVNTKILDLDFSKNFLQIELVVQGRTILVSEKLLCQHSVYFR